MAIDPLSTRPDSVRAAIARNRADTQRVERVALEPDTSALDITPRWVFRRIQAKEALSTGLTATVDWLELLPGTVLHAAMLQVAAPFAGPSLSAATLLQELDGDFVETGKGTAVTIASSPVSSSDFWLDWHGITGPGACVLRASISLTGCNWDNLTGGDCTVYALLSRPGSLTHGLPLGSA